MELGEEVALVGRRSSRIRQLVITLLVDTLALSFGLTMGWPSTALPLLQSEQTPLSSGPISSLDASWLASLLCLVAMVTTPMYRYICELFGRKVCGYLTVLPGIISELLLLLTTSTAMLYTSRAIIGFTLAGTFIFCPVYVSEIAQDDIRGTLGVMIMLLRNIGLCSSYVIGTFCSFQTVTYISIIPLLLLFFALSWLPESPVYLMRCGKEYEAERALQKLRGARSDISQELFKLKTSLRDTNSETTSTATYKQFFTSAVNLRALLIMIVLNVNQQLSGFYGILMHTVVIFQSAGTTWSPFTSSIVVGAMLVCGTFLSVLLCDKIGRKVLLIVSDALMAICLLVISTYFYLKETGKDVSQLGILPTACLSVYVVALNVGLASLPVLIETELFSPRFRSTAISITAPFTWCLTFIVSKYFTAFTDYVGTFAVYWFFTSVCITGMGLIILLVPETKGRPLQSILAELETRGLCSQVCTSKKKEYESLCEEYQLPLT